MKRLLFVGIALSMMGAGCWSSEPVAVNPSPAAPVMPQPASETGNNMPIAEPTNPSPSEATGGMQSPSAATSSLVVPMPTRPVVPEPTYVTVEMSQNGFKPAQLTVKKDTIVRFKNVGGTDMWPASNPHPDHTDYQDFDARHRVKPGETYEFMFKNVGMWGYHDHMSPGLSARIVVQE